MSVTTSFGSHPVFLNQGVMSARSSTEQLSSLSVSQSNMHLMTHALNQSTAQFRVLAQRAQGLQTIIAEQALTAGEFQTQIQILLDRTNNAETLSAASSREVRKIEKKSKALAAEADKLRLLAGGVSGVAVGLGIGLSAGATGPGVLFYAAGGGAAGVGAACLYNKLT